MLDKSVKECPDCNGTNIYEATSEKACGGIAIGHFVTVPVMHCRDCGVAWTDYRAEDAEAELIRQIEHPEPQWSRADEEQMNAIADYQEDKLKEGCDD